MNPEPLSHDLFELCVKRHAAERNADAAVAFGCNPDTMRKHYIALDEVEISDRVMERIQSQT
jgi:hypothetical protein